ncbi:MAG TPA: PAS domain S-box protein, partial [Anaerolinea sp.]|nr:PAS domain S-box protein [Anaerolinea sp.]
MRIQNRLLVLSGLIGVVFIAGFYFLSQAQLRYASQLVVDQYKKLSLLFNELIVLESQPLATLVYDYTYWDALVDFVHTGDPAFAEENLAGLPQNYDLDALWVYDPQSHMVYQTARPGQAIPSPLDLFPQSLPGLFDNDPIRHFYFYLPDLRLIEFQAAVITPSNDPGRESPAQGYFFAARALDAEWLKYLGLITGSTVNLVDPGQSVIGPLDPSGDFIIQHAVSGPDGKAIAFIQGKFSNQYAVGFQQAKQRDLIFYVLFATAFLLLLIGGLAAWVTRPLQRITSSLSSNSTQPIAGLLHDRSEFGNIARLVETSFEEHALTEAALKRHEQAEMALRESQERYRIFTELTSDCAFSLHLTGNGQAVLEWGGETIQRLTGYSAEQINHLSKLRSIIHPDDRFLLDQFTQEFVTGATFTKVIRYQHARGEMRWLRIHLFPVRDAQSGFINRVYGAAQDISAEIAAQEAYRSLVDDSPFGLAIFQEGAIRFCNPALARMTGYSIEEILAFTTSQLLGTLHPSDQVDLGNTIDQALQGQGEFEMREMRIRFKDNLWHWVEIFAVRVDYHRHPALQITFHDVTDRKQAEMALDQQQQYSSAVLNTVDSLVMILEPTGEIINCNPPGLHILRAESSDLYGKTLWDLFAFSPEAPIQPDNFNTLVQTHSPVKDVDIWLPRADGRTWLAWSQGYLLDSDGKVAAVVGTANDITERKIRER